MYTYSSPFFLASSSQLLLLHHRHLPLLHTLVSSFPTYQLTQRQPSSPTGYESTIDCSFGIGTNETTLCEGEYIDLWVDAVNLTLYDELSFDWWGSFLFPFDEYPNVTLYEMSHSLFPRSVLQDINNQGADDIFWSYFDPSFHQDLTTFYSFPTIALLPGYYVFMTHWGGSGSTHFNAHTWVEVLDRSHPSCAHLFNTTGMVSPSAPSEGRCGAGVEVVLDDGTQVCECPHGTFGTFCEQGCVNGSTLSLSGIHKGRVASSRGGGSEYITDTTCGWEINATMPGLLNTTKGLSLSLDLSLEEGDTLFLYDKDDTELYALSSYSSGAVYNLPVSYVRIEFVADSSSASRGVNPFSGFRLNFTSLDCTEGYHFSQKSRRLSRVWRSSLFECLPCPPGSFSPQAGGHRCRTCTVNTYQPLEGQSMCLDCPEGTFTDSRGQTQCKRCHEHEYPEGCTEEYHMYGFAYVGVVSSLSLLFVAILFAFTFTYWHRQNFFMYTLNAHVVSLSLLGVLVLLSSLFMLSEQHTSSQTCQTMVWMVTAGLDLTSIPLSIVALVWHFQRRKANTSLFSQRVSARALALFSLPFFLFDAAIVFYFVEESDPHIRSDTITTCEFDVSEKVSLTLWMARSLPHLYFLYVVSLQSTTVLCSPHAGLCVKRATLTGGLVQIFVPCLALLVSTQYVYAIQLLLLSLSVYCFVHSYFVFGTHLLFDRELVLNKAHIFDGADTTPVIATLPTDEHANGLFSNASNTSSVASNGHNRGSFRSRMGSHVSSDELSLFANESSASQSLITDADALFRSTFLTKKGNVGFRVTLREWVENKNSLLRSSPFWNEMWRDVCLMQTAPYGETHVTTTIPINNRQAGSHPIRVGARGSDTYSNRGSVNFGVNSTSTMHSPRLARIHSPVHGTSSRSISRTSSMKRVPTKEQNLREAVVVALCLETARKLQAKYLSM